MTPREVIVSPTAPMPAGYAFLKKGIKYKTLHCRRLTHEAGKAVYVVQNNKTVLGIRIPKRIFFEVQALANDTFASRRLATEKRDAAIIRAAAAELDQQFPFIPATDRDNALNHGFKKHSGRVGRTNGIPLPRKVLFAVIAHIRHKHTEYDRLLKKGLDRDDARKAIHKKMQNILGKWGVGHGMD